ncbi:MAG: GspH/FimT family pseudopilin [Comamonas sp.]|nr:GspH/FimT family pseudopilin [Comamonas sp.]
MHASRSVRGFTLIELMVGLAITVFLLLLAIPSASVYILDSRIRAAAQAYYDGAQLARAEALRRNAYVALGMTDSNLGWTVTVANTQIASKSVESATNLTVQAEQGTVTFDSVGRTPQGNTVNFKPTNAACLADSGTQRCLRVVISPGGQVRMCDPAIGEEGDNRKC